MRAALVALALAACSGAPAPARVPPPDPPAARTEAPEGILSYIPAETPYVFATLSRPPAGEIERTVTSWLARLDRVAGLAAELPIEAAEAGAEHRLYFAVLRELRGRLSIEGLRELGIDVGAPVAIFGLGPYPALRLELLDAAAFAAPLARIMETVPGVESGELGGRRYWERRLGALLALVAIDGDQLSAALIPASMRGQLMPMILGMERPRRTLAASGELGRLARRHGLAGYRIGVIDVARTLEVALAPGAVAVAGKRGPAAIETFGLDPEDRLGPACRRQLASLGTAMPRIILGPRRSGRLSESGSLIALLRPDVAARLRAEAASIPGLETELGRRADLFVGLGLRPSGLLRLAASATSRIPSCPLPELDTLRRQLEEVARAAAPVGGTSIAVTELVEDAGGDLERITGAMAASLDDVDAVHEMLSGWMPTPLPAPASRLYPLALPAMDDSLDPVWLWIGSRGAGLSFGFERGEALRDFATRGAASAVARIRIAGPIAELADREEPDPELAALDPELAESLAALSEERFTSVDLTVRLVKDRLVGDFEITYRSD